MSWLWINFVDITVTQGSFLGIAVIREDNIARMREIDPGGHLDFRRCPGSWGDPPEMFRDRLLTYPEANDLSIAWTGTELANVNGELAN